MVRWIKWTSFILVLALLGALGWALARRLGAGPGEAQESRGGLPVPVEVAPVEQAAIEWRRTYSGALQPFEIIVVAPKVSGRIDKLTVDLADEVEKGHVVAELDNAEYLQAIAQAAADLAVAKATAEEARSALMIAQRELDRVQNLKEGGITSASELDSATVDHLTRQAALAVAEAKQQRAEATLATATIREAYTRVAVDWRDEDEKRVVGERFVNEGETVSANTPLISVVRLKPIKAVVFATEREYGNLRVGQKVTAVTDAYPNRPFPGTIKRISPVFRETSRQARIELEIDNSREELKPGMFVRVDIVLQRIEKTTVVPATALTSRDDVPGIFLVDPGGKRVTWCPVQPGIRDGVRLQVLPVEREGVPPIHGRVVTLGQQLLADGSAVVIPEHRAGSQKQAKP